MLAKTHTSIHIIYSSIPVLECQCPAGFNINPNLTYPSDLQVILNTFISLFRYVLFRVRAKLRRTLASPGLEFKSPAVEFAVWGEKVNNFIDYLENDKKGNSFFVSHFIKKYLN